MKSLTNKDKDTNMDTEERQTLVQIMTHVYKEVQDEKKQLEEQLEQMQKQSEAKKQEIQQLIHQKPRYMHYQSKKPIKKNSKFSNHPSSSSSTPSSSSSSLSASSSLSTSSSSPASSPSPASLSTSCVICFNDFDNNLERVLFTNCGHKTVCRNCFREYIHIHIRDKDVLPWLRCPTSSCKAYLHSTDLIASLRYGITPLELYSLLAVFFEKSLARVEQFISCKTKGCGFGFLLDEPILTEKERMEQLKSDKGKNKAKEKDKKTRNEV